MNDSIARRVFFCRGDGHEFPLNVNVLPFLASFAVSTLSVYLVGTNAAKAREHNCSQMHWMTIRSGIGEIWNASHRISPRANTLPPRLKMGVPGAWGATRLQSK